MEQNHKIKMKPVVVYDVEDSDLKRVYTHFSLVQYHWLRKPEYNDHLAITQLRRDFKRYLVEMQVQSERDENNKTLSQIRMFFERNYTRLNSMIEAE